jgi:hypothetical protein
LIGVVNNNMADRAEHAQLISEGNEGGMEEKEPDSAENKAEEVEKIVEE